MRVVEAEDEGRPDNVALGAALEVALSVRVVEAEVLFFREDIRIAGRVYVSHINESQSEQPPIEICIAETITFEHRAAATTLCILSDDKIVIGIYS